MANYKELFSEVEIGNTTVKNRILTTAHQTNHVVDGIPTDDLVAYHEARAKGGVGLMVLEAAAIHDSGMLTRSTIAAYDPKIKSAYKKIMDAVKPYDSKIFVQLFHAGREVVSSDYRKAALAPSAVPSLRFSTMPKPMNLEEIHDVIDGFKLSAKYAKEGGLDGIEVCCSHGYLPAQFWNNQTNLRTDEYGGSFENRMRFIVEILDGIWETVGEDFTVGIRMSSNEMTMDGTKVKDAVEIVEYLVDKTRVDFINVTAGDSSTFAGSTHIVPPSPMKQAYLSADSFKVRMAGAVPVFVGSRIIDPVQGNDIIKSGKADMVSMTRATIVDPMMPNKAAAGDLQSIDACIGCLQACIGNYHKGLTIGCIQNPQAGKENEEKAYLLKKRTKESVVVIGAGPGGLEAAISADSQGHDVTLIDEGAAIGGLLLKMRRGPMRQEMADSMIDNYLKQLDKTSIKLKLNTQATKESINELKPNSIICATGSRPFIPEKEGMTDERVKTVDDLFSSQSQIEKHEMIYIIDYIGDWGALEAALYAAEKGANVTLVTARLYAAEGVPQYLRNEYLKRLRQLKVNIIAQHDLGGITKEGLVIRNLFDHTKEIIEDFDKVFLSYGRIPNLELYESLKHEVENIYSIGDCLAPRTIEEATLEGYRTAMLIGTKEANDSIMN